MGLQVLLAPKDPVMIVVHQENPVRMVLTALEDPSDPQGLWERKETPEMMVFQGLAPKVLKEKMALRVSQASRGPRAPPDQTGIQDQQALKARKV